MQFAKLPCQAVEITIRLRILQLLAGPLHQGGTGQSPQASTICGRGEGIEKMLQFSGARGVEDVSRTDESAGKSALSELFSNRLSLSMTANKNA